MSCAIQKTYDYQFFFLLVEFKNMFTTLGETTQNFEGL
jgi:hypothetical protein